MSSDEEDFGPAPAKKARKKAHIDFEKLYLSSLPSAEMYEKSYMHIQAVTHVVVTVTEFIITASKDGQMKFWKKRPEDIEFVKRFYGHRGKIGCLSVSRDGLWLASCAAADQSIKVFDVINFDMINMIQLEFKPSVCTWVHHSGAAQLKIACGDSGSGDIHILDARGKATPLNVVKIHSSPVVAIKFNEPFDTVISCEAKGPIDYWNPTTFRFPENLGIKYRTDTHLFELAKSKTSVVSLNVSGNGELFAVMAKDRQVRIFRFHSAKLYRKYDESLEIARDLQAQGNLIHKLDEIDFGRRLAIENTISGDNDAPPPAAIFDDSGNFLFYPTLVGIKMVNIRTNRLVKVIGKFENTERFLDLALYQGHPRNGGQVGETEADPTLFAVAYDKQRFYMFTRREPREDIARDIFNEKPPKELLQAASATAKNSKVGRGATIHTSMGDIVVKLFGDECPKTVENFTTHSRNNYYNGLIFHRVIKSFMIQTGDPSGDGTGGTSIWGREFEDEFHRSLRHDRPFTLSMANSGPNSNGSQFFITTVPCPWLDNKHTVFGRVAKGFDVVQKIEAVPTDDDDMPKKEVRLLNIEILDQVPE